MAERPPAAAAGAAAARRIAVVGTGYVGLTTGACLCSLGHQVICADVDSGNVSRLACGEVDITEPGLAELLRAGLASRRLSFVTGVAAALTEADIVMRTPVVVDTRNLLDSGVLRRSGITYTSLGRGLDTGGDLN